MRTSWNLLPILLVVLTACASDEAPLGLAQTDRSQPGPTIVWKPLERPQPDIPFPNDLALARHGDGSIHLNTSTQASTQLEQRLRRHLDEIDGFSGLTPITLSFDGPLDLTTVTDDAILVINVQADSPRFGERMQLDLGRGWFPHRADPHAYFPFDLLANFDSYVLPPDNLADRDGDGKLEWVYHYETKTHTLDIRPLLPLQAGAQYAIVLTRAVKGWDKDGKYGPIRSPFDWVNHATQTDDLKRALPALRKAGVEPDDVAFAWTLTTGDLARTFRALRDGLYGKGPFAWLDKEFPAKLGDVYDMEITFDGDGTYPDHKPLPKVDHDHTFILQGAWLEGIFGLINQFVPAGGFSHVSHVVFGDMETPNFRATSDNVWQIDIQAGKAKVDPKQFHEKVPFVLIVPKTTEQHKPPFPVVVYAHATGTSRIECLLLADRLAQAGIATFSIDAVGHGPVLADPLKFLANQGGGTDYLPLLRNLLPMYLYKDGADHFPAEMSDDEVVKEMLKHGFLQQLAVKGRAVDDNGDCFIKGGEAYYAPDAFRLRDAMRQTTFDYIVAVRILRALNQNNVPKPPADPRKASRAELMPSLLAGDFDCDGVLDIGGKDVPYFMTGVSLGGIHTALTAPLEPYIVAAAPVVPGAGLADIFIRTRLHNIVTPLVHATSGPKVVGCPIGKGQAGKDFQVELSLNDDSDNCTDRKLKTYKDPKSGQCLEKPVEVPVGLAELTVPAGARVVVKNERSGEKNEALARPDGGFAIAVAADAGDQLSVTVWEHDRPTVSRTITTPYSGLARERNTPDFRKFVQLAANILEGADAITVADRVLIDPLPGYPSTNLLMMLAVGDQTVPYATGLSLARSIGLFGRQGPGATSEPFRPWFELAITAGSLMSKDVAPALLDPSKPEGGPGLCRTLPTQEGQPALSGLCLADVRGHHEYIAQVKEPNQFPKFQQDGKDYAGSYTEYHRNLIVSYFHSLAKRVPQDPCWADPKCVADRKLTQAWDAPIGTVN